MQLMFARERSGTDQHKIYYWVEETRKVMRILRFEVNIPVRLALKCDGGRAVNGQYGPQVLYTLEDGRLMYLEPKVARRIGN